jgi:biotin transporter BioY
MIKIIKSIVMGFISILLLSGCGVCIEPITSSWRGLQMVLIIITGGLLFSFILYALTKKNSKKEVVENTDKEHLV